MKPLAVFAAAGAIAAILCPVPRPRTLSLASLAAIAVLYVAAIAIAGAAASYKTWSRIAGRVTWVAPAAVFYGSRSLWSVLAAALLASAAARSMAGGPAALTALQGWRLAAMVAAAMCLQLSVVFVFRDMVRPAALAFGTAVAAIAWFRHAGETVEDPSTRRTLTAVMLSIVFTAMSLLPYLPPPKLTRTVRIPPEAQAAVKPRQSAKSIAPAPKVLSDAYAGLILRPESKDYVLLVPPLAAKRPRAERTMANPDSIPFRGAYWFYRASAKTLPPGAVESRGDPASLAFRTTDFTPISMEARQNFGRLFDLDSCEAIEVEIANEDRVPETVSIELTVVNTTLPTRPAQSLGILPVNSTAHWRPGGTESARGEVLRYAVPATPAIRKFDEVILRYVLRPPREIWSARIAIERFRLVQRIPHKTQ